MQFLQGKSLKRLARGISGTRPAWYGCKITSESSRLRFSAAAAFPGLF
jgi:hypothetical protein